MSSTTVFKTTVTSNKFFLGVIRDQYEEETDFNFLRIAEKKDNYIIINTYPMYKYKNYWYYIPVCIEKPYKSKANSMSLDDIEFFRDIFRKPPYVKSVDIDPELFAYNDVIYDIETFQLVYNVQYNYNNDTRKTFININSTDPEVEEDVKRTFPIPGEEDDVNDEMFAWQEEYEGSTSDLDFKFNPKFDGDTGNNLLWDKFFEKILYDDNKLIIYFSNMIGDTIGLYAHKIYLENELFMGYDFCSFDGLKFSYIRYGKEWDHIYDKLGIMLKWNYNKDGWELEPFSIPREDALNHIYNGSYFEKIKYDPITIPMNKHNCSSAYELLNKIVSYMQGKDKSSHLDSSSPMELDDIGYEPYWHIV